ncbi:putative bifunctional diguanylate cyclase/phosphodiesterase [Actinoplanes sp. NPDC051494]|uniref:putative bifunctional diguanylate cyclase/phosphodiesterase n=1 Tax=Actinoplanes sp. NPDC051494 TaxID=3363907 RepID=UPI0037AD9DE2
MEESGTRSARLLTVSVWGVGVLLCLSLVQALAGWHDEVGSPVNDLIRLPVTVLTAVLGLWLVLRGGLARQERRAWVLLEVAFVAQVLAHGASLFGKIQPGGEHPYPSPADYLYAVAIPVTVAGLLLLPAARRSSAERLKLLIDSFIVVAGACMAIWYLEIAPVVQMAGADLELIIFSAAVPILDLLLLFALILLILRRPDIGVAIGLLAGSMALKVIADSTYTIAYVQFGVAFGQGSWPYLLWAAGDLLALLAVHRRLRQDYHPHGERRSRRRISWLPYVAVALADGLLAYVGRHQSLYALGGMIAGAIVLTTLVIARQMLAQRENRRLAVVDPLTGLANRALLTERLDDMTRQPLRPGRHSAVLLIDLDRFKPINDAYGHEAGDAVLRAVATSLRSVIRSGDTAGRLGGDEFAVVLPHLPTRAAAESVAQRLVEALRTPVIFGELVLGVEASVGVAFRDESITNTEQLMKNADIAMYAVKRAGRGAYLVYTPELDIRTRDLELRRAVDNNELVVDFQPIIDLASGAPVGAEALVRWNHPTRGLLMPGAFIELAEETGAIVPIGEWVLRESCRQAVTWRAGNPDPETLWLSVNLSARQVVQPRLLETIRGILDETGFPADRLVLELTESVILQPDEQTVARLNALRDLGIGIAVDDFGTGYAALSYLSTLPVTVMKIDRTFVAAIETDPDAYAVTEALVRLAKAYKLRVTAEGIETAGQSRRLTDMGCDFGQGYFYARPMPGAALAELLGTRHHSRLTGHHRPGAQP